MCLDAQLQCHMTWRPRFYLEDWFAKERCTPAEPGQADPELEEALAGCTAGAPFTSVPVGSSSNDVNQLGWGARRAAAAAVLPSLLICLPSHLSLPAAHLSTCPRCCKPIVGVACLDYNRLYPPGHLLPRRYWENSILFEMDKFRYNDTFARLALGGAPPPKEFTFVYFVGYGCLPPDHVARQLRQMNETGDAVVLNLGPHCLAQLSFPEWRRSMNDVAGQLAAMRSRVVWRTSFPMREDALRTPLPDASSYTPHLLFPVSCSRRRGRTACNPAGGECRPAPLPQPSVAPCASRQLGLAQPLPMVWGMLA